MPRANTVDLEEKISSILDNAIAQMERKGRSIPLYENDILLEIDERGIIKYSKKRTLMETYTLHLRN